MGNTCHAMQYNANFISEYTSGAAGLVCIYFILQNIAFSL